MEGETESPVQQLFRDAGVLVTGSTGFLGQLLLEKLLRSCPGIKTVFLLIRSKKEKTEAKRFAQIFDGTLFDLMKKACPDYMNKVRLIPGDCGLPNLGIEESDREILCQEVHVVFHIAATVRFDEKLKTAVHINVRGTKQLLDLARLMPHLKSFVHVSSAYANCPEKHIEECFYPASLKSDTAIQLVELVQEDVLNAVTPIILQDWPNTYTFTKAIAEDAVREFGKGMPVAMVRPSIVIATAQEPIPGWINNVYGATGVVLGAGMGILRTMHCNPDMMADIVPADMVINVMIASAWDVATRHRLNLEKLQHKQLTEVLPTPDDDISIFNFVSSTQNPITWSQYMKYNESGKEYPSVQILWYYCFRLNKYRILHNLYVVFLHLLPAIIVDTVARLIGKKPILWKAYQKIHKFVDVVSYFSVQQWKFTDHNVQALQSRMTPLDQELFDFNIARLDWHSVLKSSVRGLRLHFAKESLDNLEVAKKRYRRLKIAHYTLVYSLFFILLALIIWIIVSIVM